MKLKSEALTILALCGWGFVIYWLIIAYLNNGISYVDFNQKGEMVFELFLFPLVFLIIIWLGVEVIYHEYNT